jgi:hypothetical protein
MQVIYSHLFLAESCIHLFLECSTYWRVPSARQWMKLMNFVNELRQWTSNKNVSAYRIGSQYEKDRECIGDTVSKHQKAQFSLDSILWIF